MKKPNILFIISDEHSFRTMGCMGADYVKTPNLDRLAHMGTTFDNAYCNYALCVPSRAGIMTGLQCYKTECYDNGAPFSSTLPTWAHMLVKDGYRCVLDGKMHFRGPDQLHGFEEHWHEPEYDINGYRWGDENPSGNGYRAFADIEIIDRPEDHPFSMKDRVRTDAAVEFLNHSPENQPFCLTVGYIYPHYPMVCDRELYESYTEMDIPDPIPSESWSTRNAFFGNDVWGFNKFTSHETGESRRAYLTMVTMTDRYVGELLDALEKNNLMDDTIIIYTTDHGDMWGEHGFWGKNFFYEDSSRVPLIIAGKKFGIQENTRINTPVSLLDLYPTFRDMACIEDWNMPLDGRSLWKALTGEEVLEDQPVFCEYYGSDVKGPERMVRFRNFKLNYYYQQGVELFDLESDPQELNNLADNPDYQTEMNTLMLMLMTDWDPDEIYQKIRINQNRRTYISKEKGT